MACDGNANAIAYYSTFSIYVIAHLIHQGYSESLANGISMVIKYDRKEMVVLYDVSRRREERGGERLRNP